MKSTFAVAALCLTSVLAMPAQAATSAQPPLAMAGGVDGNKVLAAIDLKAAEWKDESFSAEMKIIKAGQLKKTLVFKSTMKGLDKQYLEFLKPGDVAGMKVLMQDAKTLYVYLPEFKKVRRVAAHAMNQGFLGSQFTYEDMTQAELSPYFNAVLGGQKGNETTLTLTPKDDAEVSWSKIELVIDKTKGGVTKLTYFDGAGKVVREQTRTEWVKVEGKLVPTKITMLNLKTGDVTVITRSEIQANTGVDESTFSRRALLRG